MAPYYGSAPKPCSFILVIPALIIITPLSPAPAQIIVKNHDQFGRRLSWSKDKAIERFEVGFRVERLGFGAEGLVLQPKPAQIKRQTTTRI